MAFAEVQGDAVYQVSTEFSRWGSVIERYAWATGGTVNGVVENCTG